MEFLDRWLAETAAVFPVRPLVTLSYAQSLDGSISLRRGQPLTISGPESAKLTHRLRAAHDAILVGIGTVLVDDPQLNVRLAEGDNPQVVVLDSQLRLPESAKLFQSEKKPWIFCLSSGSKENQSKLEAAGARVERQEGSSKKHIDVFTLLSRLKELGIATLMVEGGGEVISSFLASGLVDRIMLTVGPMFIGGYKVPLIPDHLLQVTDARVEKVGDDIVILGTFAKAVE